MTKKNGIFTSEIWNEISTLKNPNEWYHLNKIAKKCKKTPTIMQRRLDLAVKENILEKKGIERRIFYKLNIKNKKVINMLKVMGDINI